MTIGSDTAANNALDACYGDAHSSAWPATVDVALFIGDPLVDGVEVSGSGYARVMVANNSTAWPAATGRVKSNGVEIVFPESTAAYSGVVTHWATVVATGELCDVSPLGQPLDVDAAGVTPRFVAGALTISYPA